MPSEVAALKKTVINDLRAAIINTFQTKDIPVNVEVFDKQDPPGNFEVSVYFKSYSAERATNRPLLGISYADLVDAMSHVTAYAKAEVRKATKRKTTPKFAPVIQDVLIGGYEGKGLITFMVKTKLPNL